MQMCYAKDFYRRTLRNAPGTKSTDRRFELSTHEPLETTWKRINNEYKSIHPWTSCFRPESWTDDFWFATIQPPPHEILSKTCVRSIWLNYWNRSWTESKKCKPTSLTSLFCELWAEHVSRLQMPKNTYTNGCESDLGHDSVIFSAAGPFFTVKESSWTMGCWQLKGGYKVTWRQASDWSVGVYTVRAV